MSIFRSHKLRKQTPPGLLLRKLRICLSDIQGHNFDGLKNGRARAVGAIESDLLHAIQETEWLLNYSEETDVSDPREDQEGR